MDELRRALSAALLGWWLAGCAASPPAAPALARTFDSKQALARAVLEGFAHRDSEGLRGLALDGREFRQVVWPLLPASRPEMNVPVGYAWGALSQNSRGSLATLLDEHGGRRYHLLDVSFAGETRLSGPLTVHRKAVLQVRDADGRKQRVRLFGSAIEHQGRWKLFSYVVD